MFKRHNYILLLFAALFFMSAGINPVMQQAAADLKKVNETYSKTESFSMDTYYMVFSEHETASMLEAKNGKYIKYKNNNYTKIDDIEVVSINEMMISINKSDKLISVGDNPLKEVNPLTANLDSLLTICTSVKVEQVNANEKKYSLRFDDSDIKEYDRIDISINTVDYRYTRIVLFYNMAINLKTDFYAEEKQPRLEIMYKNYKVLTADPLIFQQSLYIHANGDKLTPASKYYNYRLSDLRNKTRIKKAK